MQPATREGVAPVPACLILGGGVLMFLSMFFRYVYGPWGTELSYFSLLRWNLHGESWRMWVTAWPVAFGLVQAVAGAFLVGGSRLAGRGRWWATAGLLGAVAAFFLVEAGLACLQVADGEVPDWLAPLLLQGGLGLLSLLLLIAIALRVRQPDRKAHWAALVGTGWLLVSLYPVSDWTPLETVLWAYGLGYWLLLAGTLLVAAGSIARLAAPRFRGTPGQFAKSGEVANTGP